MVMSSKTMGRLCALATVAVVLLGAPGCGYLKNVRDDVMDLGELSIGVNLPRMGSTASPFQPPVGVYVEATDFLHFGAISRSGGNLEWDRRGVGVLGDVRKKIGFGPWHKVNIKQMPGATNGYKRAGGKLDGWRGHMRSMALGDSPAKELVFTGEDSPYFYRGWQDFAHFSVEASLCEPILLHLGVYARVGVDASQVMDLAFSMLLLDIWGDDAFKFWSGKPKY